MYKLPKEVNIMGNIYKVIACETTLEVDPAKRVPLFGTIDFYERIIRIYAHERSDFDLQQVLLHEILHGITQELHLAIDEEVNDTLATVILDTFIRNGLLK